ncbi:hypothetical protein [Sphingopyxis sp. YF1]|uniref:hypothetical protein n=1 Tax=Sphingopyxis sp. YF1 TaxID=2482763 RepID=UPI001F621B2F|nr:hypothetical protein [Sphingopyxis sp. YF1]
MAASAATLAIPLATPASAQATRTWISGVGDDVNPCSRTAPCKTFAGSIAKTAAGGEINCLDPGGFGTVTITKSIKLLCDNVGGGITASGTNGITINAGVDDVIVISGLEIDGLGTGVNGIRFLGGGGLHLRNSTIRGFKSATSYAVNFAPTSLAATLVLDNVTIVKNGLANNSGGILIQPAANVAVTFAIDKVKIADNGGTGLRVDTTGINGASVKGVVSNSVFADAANAVFAKVPAGSTANILVAGNSIGTNQNGVVSQDVGATVRVSDNLISSNSAFGVRSISGGTLISYGDNELTNNGTNGTFTSTVSKQ